MGAKIIWLTGLSGSGKTTLANIVSKKIIKNKKGKVLLIDGDIIRKKINKKLSFTKDDIIKNNRSIHQLIKEKRDYFAYIFVSVITPFTDIRNESKKIFGNDYYEVYVKASINSLIDRDVKGLYKRAINGEIDNFIGISPKTPFEVPEKPDIIINTNLLNLHESVELLYKNIIIIKK